jgi:hypothetical protein
LDPGAPAPRYRIPSSPMPRTTLRQPDGGQPTPPHQPELPQSVDGVLTTCWGEPARRQSQRRHHMPVQLDGKNQPTHHHRLGAAQPPRTPYCHHIHRADRADSIRRKPARSSSANRAEPTSRLLGSARITMYSDRSILSMTSRATWRSRRANRCRCTADPTDRETIRPTFGASAAVSSPRRT